MNTYANSYLLKLFH